ncbi:MAG: calcium-binding protein [Actinomycetota bacterium]
MNRGIVGWVRLLGLTLAACLALGAASAASALASTVSKSGSTLTYTAANGEANQTIVSLAGGVYTIQDSGATIAGGTACSAVNANKVTCPGAGLNAITVNAGDMNDLVWVTAPTNAIVTGAAGNDTLIGGNGNDVLIGCAGDDNLSGLGGADTLLDGALNCAGGGNDTLDGGAGPDVMFGGPGTDTVTYAGRTASVFVSLDGVANDGEAGEGDSVANDIENVTGGSGDDSITGSSAANIILGGAGNDVLLGERSDSALDPNYTGSGNDSIFGGDGNDAIGGGNGDNLLSGGNGDDSLYGGPGADSFDGGSGNDDLEALDGVVDALNCGTGTDSGAADQNDVVSPSCEAVTLSTYDPFGGDTSGTDSGSTDCGGSFFDSFGSSGGDPFAGLDGPCLDSQGAVCAAVRVSRHAAIHGGAVGVRVSLPKALAGLGLVCKGKLRLDALPGKAHKPDAKGLKIGSTSFSLKGGQAKRIDLQINRVGRRRLERAGRMPARASVFAKGSASPAKSSTITINAG